MLLYGCGGHARVVWTALDANGVRVTAFFDDDHPESAWGGAPILDGYRPDSHPDQELIIAIGDNRTRERLATTVEHRFGKVVHPTAIVDGSIDVGEGSMILHGAIVQIGVQVGRHVIVNSGASVDHDCSIGDLCHLAPGVVVCGDVTIGERTLVGAGAVVLPGVTVGSDAIVGAGAVVNRDVAAGATVVGNPAVRVDTGLAG